MAWRSRGPLTGAVLLAYALLLTLPEVPWPNLQQAAGWVDSRWPPRSLSIDARVLDATGIALAVILILASAVLVRRRRFAAGRTLACTQLEAELGRREILERRLRGRLADWVELSYPITVRCDPDGHHVELSDPAAAANGDSPVTLRMDQLPDPAHRVALRNAVSASQTRTPPREPVEVLVDDGPHGSRWLELRLRHEIDPIDGEFVYGRARDVTSRKEDEQGQSVRTLIDAAWRSHAPLDSELVVVLQRLVDSLRCDLAEVWWVDGHFSVLHRGVSAHAGGEELEVFSRRSAGRTFGKGWGLAGRVWADDAVVRLDDLAKAADPRCARLAETGPFRSAVGVPVRVAGRMIGCVVLLTGRSRLDPISARRLEELGAAIGELVDHKRNERELLDDEARKNAMLESALDCVVTIDAQGRIMEFNPAAEKTFGRSRSEVLGQSMAELLIPEEYRENQTEAFQRCLDPGARRFTGRRLESEGIRADGGRFPIEISITSIHVGNAPRFTAYLRDITDRKELDRLKDELVSTVSHELRTPLTSMRGFVELLLTREFPPAEQRRFLEIVETETKRLGKLIDDFLDLQRLESGALEYDFERLAIGPLIREATEMFEHASEQHDYVVDIPDCPIHVEGDADRLRQILRNLLSNATKYSPEGGLVAVSVALREGRVRVSIRDEGIGMDVETQRKLFRRFYRADSTATRRIGGTGLGLALVKEIVEAHGGKVGVESEPGKGSEFFFELALAGDGS